MADENPPQAVVDLNVHQDEIEKRLEEELRSQGHQARSGMLPGIPGAQAAPDLSGLVTAGKAILPTVLRIIADILARKNADAVTASAAPPAPAPEEGQDAGGEEPKPVDDGQEPAEAVKLDSGGPRPETQGKSRLP